MDINFSQGSSGEEALDSGDSKDELANLPFEAWEKLRCDGEKSFLEAVRTKDKRKFKRSSKNQPMEMSSKKPVSRLRDTIEIPGRRVCDPRFESLCGTFHSGSFRKRYSFLYDDVLPAEAEQIHRKFKKARNLERKEALKARYARLQQQIRDEQARKDRETWETGWKNREREAVRAGKKPYYLKASEKKRMDLIQKYHRLKEEGRLQKFIKRQRKRCFAREHKANRRKVSVPKRRKQVQASE